MAVDPRCGELAGELSRAFEDHVVKPWFPRCIDPQGGFQQSFSEDWTPTPDRHRTAVFQSRMVWFTAQLAPTDSNFAAACAHGVRYIHETLFDSDHKLHGIIDLDHRQLANRCNLYDLAFTIFGLAAAGRALNDARAVDSAWLLFQQLEMKHVQSGSRGYEDTGLPAIRSQNAHLHLVEALCALHAVRPEPIVRNRLTECIQLFTDELLSPDGYLQDHVHIDGKIGDGSINYGHDMEVAHLLLSTSEAAGMDQATHLETAILLTDHALRDAWDHENGGFYGIRRETGNLVRSKIWWVQCEAILCLAILYDRTGSRSYLDALELAWKFFRDHQIDHSFGGVYDTLSEAGFHTPGAAKGHIWKAAYHDGRALMQTASVLKAISVR